MRVEWIHDPSSKTIIAAEARNVFYGATKFDPRWLETVENFAVMAVFFRWFDTIVVCKSKSFVGRRAAVTVGMKDTCT